jgi:hypothetical protein
MFTGVIEVRLGVWPRAATVISKAKIKTANVRIPSSTAELFWPWQSGSADTAFTTRALPTALKTTSYEPGTMYFERRSKVWPPIGENTEPLTDTSK